MLYHPKAVNKELVIHAVQIRVIIEKEAYFSHRVSTMKIGDEIYDMQKLKNFLF